MFYVYVLKSQKNGKFYTGFTTRNPYVRLKEHNKGVSTYTRNNRPFELIYFEKYEDEIFACKREKYLKTGQGRSFIKKKLSVSSARSSAG